MEINERKQLIDELLKMPPIAIATAYIHAINYTMYGENVTEKWLTATQQSSALEKAHMKGYYDAMQDINKNYIPKDLLGKMRADIMKLQTYKMFPYEATVYVERDEVLRIFDEYTTGGEEDARSD